MESFKANKNQTFSQLSVNSKFIFLHDIQDNIIFIYQKLSDKTYQGIRILENKTKKQPNPLKIKGYTYSNTPVMAILNENQNLREILGT